MWIDIQNLKEAAPSIIVDTQHLNLSAAAPALGVVAVCIIIILLLASYMHNQEKKKKASKYCSKCGEGISTGDEFCPKCGQKV